MVHANDTQIHWRRYMLTVYFNSHDNKMSKMRHITLEESLQRNFVKNGRQTIHQDFIAREIYRSSFIYTVVYRG